MRKHFCKRFTSLLLIVTMMTIDFGTPLFAVTDGAGQSESPSNEDITVTSDATEAELAMDSEEQTPVTETEALILSEVEEERQESSKTFLLTDGTFMLAQYAVPVHYEDSEGNWQEFDTTLVTEESSTEDSDGTYTTTEKAGRESIVKFS